MSKAALDWRRRQIIQNGPMMAVLHELCVIHRDGGYLYPSHQALAASTALSRRSVYTALRMLELLGVIMRTKRLNTVGGRASDLITINLSASFHLTRKVIMAARKSITPPRKDCEYPSQGVRGNKKTYEKEPSQDRIDTEVEVEHHAREASPPRLKVIVGGRA